MDENMNVFKNPYITQTLTNYTYFEGLPKPFLHHTPVVNNTSGDSLHLQPMNDIFAGNFLEKNAEC